MKDQAIKDHVLIPLVVLAMVVIGLLAIHAVEIRHERLMRDNVTTTQPERQNP